MRLVKILIRLREYVIRSDFCWAQMTNGTFSDVAAQALPVEMGPFAYAKKADVALRKHTYIILIPLNPTFIQ